MKHSDTMGPSLRVDRFRKIINLVNSNKRISLSQLETELDAARITIQRDLIELEGRKMLKRFHGGAMSLSYSEDLYDIDVKKKVNVPAKRKIAAKAASLIEEGYYIGLDSSSSVYYLSEIIFAGNVLALTCNIESFKNLSDRDDVQVVLAGGRLNKKTNTLSGPETIDMIKRFRFDVAFISADSYIPGKGFFDPHAEEVAIKRALMESSQKTAMLIDVSKISQSKGIKICDDDAINYVVTDDPGNPVLKKFFKEKLL